MIADFHFIRPWWLLALLPLIATVFLLWRTKPRLESWAAICDKHLLDHLVQAKGITKRHSALLLLLLSALLMIISLAGPSWQRLPVPAYQQIMPKVIVLDMSEAMLANDIKPDRLTRAKFKLHDLLAKSESGQTGLIVYTSEPFIVSPLTEDANTIDALLSSLTPDVMPVDGQKLDSALQMAAQLIEQAGFHYGQILVLSAATPDSQAIDEAQHLAEQAISTSAMPINNDQSLNPLFKRLAQAGQGQLLSLNGNPHELDQWLNASGKRQYNLNEQDLIPVWRDEGRWFLIPALILLLPAFRRGWLQRIGT